MAVLFQELVIVTALNSCASLGQQRQRLEGEAALAAGALAPHRTVVEAFQ